MQIGIDEINMSEEDSDNMLGNTDDQIVLP
jgi:hypothetical protein